MKRLEKYFKWFKLKPTSQKLLIVYTAVLILSILLVAFWIFIPSLVLCLNIFSNSVCSPAGIWVGLLLNIPGYLIVARLMSFSVALPGAVSFIMVMLTSLAFYYFLGVYIDKFRQSKGDLRTKYILFTVFTVLVLVALYLLQAVKSFN